MKELSHTLRIVIILIFTTFYIQISAQEIVEDKIDEFTKNSVKRTSWEKLVFELDLTAYFRISKINDIFYFDLKAMDQSVFSIAEGQEIMFKLKNGKIIKLNNLEYALTCTGCGAIGYAGSGGIGIKVSYEISKEFLDLLRANQVEKIRIYTSKGYIEKEIKEKFAKKLENAFKLI